MRKSTVSNLVYFVNSLSNYYTKSFKISAVSIHSVIKIIFTCLSVYVRKSKCSFYLVWQLICALLFFTTKGYMDRVKRIWYLLPMRAAKVQASLRIRAVSPEPSLLAHTSSESRGTFRQKARSLAQLNGWAFVITECSKTQIRLTRLIFMWALYEAVILCHYINL